jgi:hypothetical protein
VKRIVWTDPAKADVRSLSKPTAMKALQGREELRLRIGDYRLFFVCADPDTIEIRRVRHRSEAYC